MSETRQGILRCALLQAEAELRQQYERIRTCVTQALEASLDAPDSPSREPEEVMHWAECWLLASNTRLLNLHGTAAQAVKAFEKQHRLRLLSWRLVIPAGSQRPLGAGPDWKDCVIVAQFVDGSEATILST